MLHFHPLNGVSRQGGFAVCMSVIRIKSKYQVYFWTGRSVPIETNISFDCFFFFNMDPRKASNENNPPAMQLPRGAIFHDIEGSRSWYTVLDTIHWHFDGRTTCTQKLVLRRQSSKAVSSQLKFQSDVHSAPSASVAISLRNTNQQSGPSLYFVMHSHSPTLSTISVCLHLLTWPLMHQFHTQKLLN